MSYLEHQVDFGAHVLGFRSTHQYYKTAKYELHQTTGDGDTPGCIFRWVPHNSNTQSIHRVSLLNTMDVECSLMENTISCISITSGRMKLILCSNVL